MLNAKSSIISIVLHSLPCSVGQGLKHLNNFTRDNLKQFTILSICNIFLFPFYLLWLHDWAQLWPILTMLGGKVWNYLVIFIIDILNSPNTNASSMSLLQKFPQIFINIHFIFFAASKFPKTCHLNRKSQQCVKLNWIKQTKQNTFYCVHQRLWDRQEIPPQRGL